MCPYKAIISIKQAKYILVEVISIICKTVNVQKDLLIVIKHKRFTKLHRIFITRNRNQTCA